MAANQAIAGSGCDATTGICFSDLALPNSVDVKGQTTSCQLRFIQYYKKTPPSGGYHQMIYIHGGGWTGGSGLDISGLTQSYVNGSSGLVSFPPTGQTATYTLATLDPTVPTSTNPPTNPSINNNPLINAVNNNFVVSVVDYRLLNGAGAMSDTVYKKQAANGCLPVTTAMLKSDVLNGIYAAFLNPNNLPLAANERAVLYGVSAGAHLAVWAANYYPAVLGYQNLLMVVADSGVYNFMELWSQFNSLNNRYGNAMSDFRSMGLGLYSYNINYYSKRTVQVTSSFYTPCTNLSANSFYNSCSNVITVGAGTGTGQTAPGNKAELSIDALDAWAYNSVTTNIEDASGNPLNPTVNPTWVDPYASPTNLFSTAFQRLTTNSAEDQVVNNSIKNSLASVLSDNTFKNNTVSLARSGVPVPPMFLVATINDQFVPPEQAIDYCASLGTPTPLSDSQSGYLVFACGSSNGSITTTASFSPPNTYPINNFSALKTNPYQLYLDTYGTNHVPSTGVASIFTQRILPWFMSNNTLN